MAEVETRDREKTLEHEGYIPRAFPAILVHLKPVRMRKPSREDRSGTLVLEAPGIRSQDLSLRLSERPSDPPGA